MLSRNFWPHSARSPHFCSIARSFGGFGALSRHLGRLTAAVTEALEADALDKRSLALINAYSPGLSGAWMLQVRVCSSIRVVIQNLWW